MFVCNFLIVIINCSYIKYSRVYSLLEVPQILKVNIFLVWINLSKKVSQVCISVVLFDSLKIPNLKSIFIRLNDSIEFLWVYQSFSDKNQKQNLSNGFDFIEIRGSLEFSEHITGVDNVDDDILIVKIRG